MSMKAWRLCLLFVEQLFKQERKGEKRQASPPVFHPSTAAVSRRKYCSLRDGGDCFLSVSVLTSECGL